MCPNCDGPVPFGGKCEACKTPHPTSRHAEQCAAPGCGNKAVEHAAHPSGLRVPLCRACADAMGALQDAHDGKSPLN